MKRLVEHLRSSGSRMRFLICILIISQLCALNAHASTSAKDYLKTLEYNCDESSYPHEREVLKEKYSKIYDDRDKLIAIAKSKSEDISSSLKQGGFCIAKTDLNQDGIDDVIAYFSFYPLTCGSLGCQTMAFFVNPQGEWQEVLSLHSYSTHISLAEIYQGFRVLVIRMKISCPCDTIVRPDGREFLLNHVDRVFVYDDQLKQYKGIGIRSE